MKCCFSFFPCYQQLSCQPKGSRQQEEAEAARGQLVPLLRPTQHLVPKVQHFGPGFSEHLESNPY